MEKQNELMASLNYNLEILTLTKRMITGAGSGTGGSSVERVESSEGVVPSLGGQAKADTSTEKDADNSKADGDDLLEDQHEARSNRARKDRGRSVLRYSDGVSRDVQTGAPHPRDPVCGRCVKTGRDCFGVSPYSCDACTSAKRACDTGRGTPSDDKGKGKHRAVELPPPTPTAVKKTPRTYANTNRSSSEVEADSASQSHMDGKRTTAELLPPMPHTYTRKRSHNDVEAESALQSQVDWLDHLSKKTRVGTVPVPGWTPNPVLVPGSTQNPGHIAQPAHSVPTITDILKSRDPSEIASAVALVAKGAQRRAEAYLQSREAYMMHARAKEMHHDAWVEISTGLKMLAEELGDTVEYRPSVLRPAGW